MEQSRVMELESELSALIRDPSRPVIDPRVAEINRELLGIEKALPGSSRRAQAHSWWMKNQLDKDLRSLRAELRAHRASADRTRAEIELEIAETKAYLAELPAGRPFAG